MLQSIPEANSEFHMVVGKALDEVTKINAWELLYEEIFEKRREIIIDIAHAEILCKKQTAGEIQYVEQHLGDGAKEL